MTNPQPLFEPGTGRRTVLHPHVTDSRQATLFTSAMVQTKRMKTGLVMMSRAKGYLKGLRAETREAFAKFMELAWQDVKSSECQVELYKQES